MSRIHDALKKAEQEKLPESLPHEAVTAEAASAPNSNHGAQEHAPDALNQRATGPSEGKLGTMEEASVTLLEGCRRHDWKAEAGLIEDKNSHRQAVVSEEFRSLRSGLQLMRKRHSLRKLLITSPLPQEGKTFTAANLAQAFARQPDSRVLLVDGDLRVSALHGVLGAPPVPGLSEYLAGDAEVSSVLQRGSANNFFFIPGGEKPANPTELLGNGRFELLMNRLAPAFDWIILDSPPVLPVSDARLLAQFCDGVLMLIRAGVTSSDLARKACHEFPKSQLLGVVLNYAEFQPGHNYYYYYGAGKPKNGNGR
jgi:capsular exopolysaccharide synthesis family protein